MKSKTSCYDSAFCRMELRRFAPVWVLYTIGMLMLAVTGFDMCETTFAKLGALNHFFNLSAVLTCGCALVLGQLFFGDLYTPRLCYAIHSLPVTRGGWFGTQIILGIFGSLIPSCVTACALLVLVPEYRITVAWWLLGSELQFLTFFGLAVLSAVCAGNRFGMLILYGVLNLADVFITWLKVKIFAPLIYAMYLPGEEIFFSPVYRLADLSLIDIQTESISELVKNPDGSTYTAWTKKVIGVALDGDFRSLLIWAAVGCVAIWLSMRLFRKRRPECAGDLLAFPKLEPVMLAVCTFFAGIAAHAVGYLLNRSMAPIFLAIGLAVGYYACLMLLKRKVNVFTKKSVLPLAGMCALLVICLTLTGLDVFGLAYRQPKPEKIASVEVKLSNGGKIQTEDPEEIKNLMQVHNDLMDAHRVREAARPLPERIFGDEGVNPGETDENGRELMTNLLYLTYHLKDGSMLRRCYFLNKNIPSIDVLAGYLSRRECVFNYYGHLYLDEDGGYEKLLPMVKDIYVSCTHSRDYSSGYTQLNGQEEYCELLEAVMADCEAGTMAQNGLFHNPGGGVEFISFDIDYEQNDFGGFSIYIYADCANTMAWLTEQGCHSVSAPE